MKRLRRFIIKNKTNGGFDAKQYVYLLEDDKGNKIVNIILFVLRRKPINNIDSDFIFVKETKNNVLFFRSYSTLLDTIRHINRIFKDY